MLNKRKKIDKFEAKNVPQEAIEARLLDDVVSRRAGVGDGFGEELPKEKDIKVFLVSSNMDVYRFWVNTMLAKVAINAKQKMALKLM